MRLRERALERIRALPGQDAEVIAVEGIALVARLEGIGGAGLPDLLDWAEEYRGARAPAA